jgi:hypothetical protein
LVAGLHRNLTLLALVFLATAGGRRLPDDGVAALAARRAAGREASTLTAGRSSARLELWR